MSYESLCADTKAGKRGVVNAQFWRDYIDMADIDNYMLSSRVIHTNYVIFMLGKRIGNLEDC